MKVPAAVQELMSKELQHDDVNQRILALLRFNTLWRMRWQVWPRMEDGANMSFKVITQHMLLTTIYLYRIHSLQAAQHNNHAMYSQMCGREKSSIIFCFLFSQCPPPNIDFVLPSPTIGLPMVAVVDPPWQPHLKTKVEEVALNQEESVS